MPVGMPTGMPDEAGAKIEGARSIFNPADAAMMKTRGDVTAQMTIRDFLQKEGLNVDGPLTQLVDYAKTQLKNASPVGKAQEIGGGMPPAGGPMGGPPMAPAGGPPPGGMPPGGQPGLSGLLGNMRG